MASCTLVIRNFEHRTGDKRFDSVPHPFLILRKNTLGWSRASHLSFPSTNLTRGLATRRLFRIPPRRKGNIHLQTSLSSPGFEFGPYGIKVSVTNHCTG
ncbi:hypothetical protein TNCV_2556611 [Trichonephila clavipes]|nr:hypothetical protein TNCV_2556611 [Trichonephila clavipes]